jgi:hypothetical protein
LVHHSRNNRANHTTGIATPREALTGEAGGFSGCPSAASAAAAAGDRAGRKWRAMAAVRCAATLRRSIGCPARQARSAGRTTPAGGEAGGWRGPGWRLRPRRPLRGRVARDGRPACDGAWSEDRGDRAQGTRQVSNFAKRVEPFGQSECPGSSVHTLEEKSDASLSVYAENQNVDREFGGICPGGIAT